jgi:hypothetical protein
MLVCINDSANPSIGKRSQHGLPVREPVGRIKTTLRRLSITVYRADDGGGVAGTKLPGPDSAACVFVFLGTTVICRSYRVTVIDQAQVDLHLRLSLFDFVKILSGDPPLRGTFFFWWGGGLGSPELVVGGPVASISSSEGYECQMAVIIEYNVSRRMHC